MASTSTVICVRMEREEEHKSISKEGDIYLPRTWQHNFFLMAVVAVVLLPRHNIIGIFESIFILFCVCFLFGIKCYFTDPFPYNKKSQRAETALNKQQNSKSNYSRFYFNFSTSFILFFFFFFFPFRKFLYFFLILSFFLWLVIYIFILFFSFSFSCWSLLYMRDFFLRFIISPLYNICIYVYLFLLCYFDAIQSRSHFEEFFYFRFCFS